jgi:hypothetical protein
MMQPVQQRSALLSLTLSVTLTVALAASLTESRDAVSSEMALMLWFQWSPTVTVTNMMPWEAWQASKNY